MCEPSSIMAGVSAAVALAGSAMSASAQKDQASQVIRAREAALRNTITKQNALREEAAQAFQPTLDDQGGTSDAAQRAAAAQAREAAYSSGADRTPTVASAAPSAATSAGVPQVVTTELNRKLARAGREGDAASGRRASLDAYGDATRNRSLGTSMARGRLGMLSDFSQGEGALLPGRLNADENSINSQGIPIWGDALRGVGTLGTMYATSRPVGWSPWGGGASSMAQGMIPRAGLV